MTELPRQHIAPTPQDPSIRASLQSRIGAHLVTTAKIADRVALRTSAPAARSGSDSRTTLVNVSLFSHAHCCVTRVVAPARAGDLPQRPRCALQPRPTLGARALDVSRLHLSKRVDVWTRDLQLPTNLEPRLRDGRRPDRACVAGWRSSRRVVHRPALRPPGSSFSRPHRSGVDDDRRE